LLATIDQAALLGLPQLAVQLELYSLLSFTRQCAYKQGWAVTGTSSRWQDMHQQI
jgi:hypothetical protein